MSTSSFDPSHVEVSVSSVASLEHCSRNRKEESTTVNSGIEPASKTMKQHVNSSNHKRASSASASKKSGLMSDFFCNQLMTSPTKRRRRYRRRNSIYIRKENMEEWSNTMLKAIGDTGDTNNNDDAQSLPDVFPSSHSTGEIASEGDAEEATPAETKANAKIYNDFHASWATSKDTQCFMELSLLSLDGENEEEVAPLKASQDKVQKSSSNEDSATSFTASSSDWTTEGSSSMDLLR